MTTQISSTNIQAATLAALSPVTITSITVTNSSWTPLDDSAVSTSGGYIVITGTNFASGCNVIISSTNATSVTFVNSTTLRVQVPAMSAGTYVVYVVNSDGGTAIIVNGLTYSGTPTWVTESPLPDGVNNTAISIQLLATGDTPMTYSLQAGSTLPTGLTLSSSGLLSGTVSGLTVATLYNFTVVATDPQFQSSPKAFSITIAVGDPYMPYVGVLVSTSTPSTRIFSSDNSVNNFPMTLNGDVRPYNFNPYTPGYYSNQFNGSSDFLSISTLTNLALGSGAFTVECWLFPSTVAAAQNIIADWRTTDPMATAPVLYMVNAQPIWRVNGTQQISSSISLTSNTWTHIAISRNSGTTTMYINGVSAGSFSDTISYTASAFKIAKAWDANYWNGSISNFRIVVGSAVYTSAFTPPTTPLTAVTNTQLLTCQDNRLIDNSVNSLTITRNGTPQVKPLNPFAPNTTYSAYGSAYFDGTGDFLSTPTGPGAFDFTSTKTLTLEFWAYVTTWGATNSCFFDIQEAQPFRILYSGSVLSVQSTVAGTTIISATIAIPTYAWVHYAFVRNTDTLYLYVNGAQVATVAYTTAWPASATGSVRIGCNRGDSWFVNGYMSDVRLVKGTALYTTSTFTPPTTPLTAISGTSLLSCQSNQPANNNPILDNSSNDLAITRNGNVKPGTFSPYGAGFSNYFDGTGNFQTSASSTTTMFGGTGLLTSSSVVTIEGWMFQTARDASADGRSMFGDFNPSGATNNWGTGTNSSGYLCFAYYNGSVQTATSSTTFIPLNTWTHFAIVISATTLKLFVNGVLQTITGVTSMTGTTTTGGFLAAGGWNSNTTNNRYFGYLSNIRVLNGTALYSTSFTPPTSPLTAIPNTVLLTSQSNSFVDNGPRNFTITTRNTPLVQRLNPFAATIISTPYYSASFNGSTDYLSVAANAAFSFAGNFTCECWVYFNTISAANQALFGNYSTNTSADWYIDTSLSTLRVFIDGGTLRMSTTVAAGTWYHVAIARSGSTVTAYLNGTSFGTYTTASTFGSAVKAIYIGSQGTSAEFLNGYISNVRFVNGTAVYTTNFTPPTAPLTAIANTSLLTCQSSTFVDNSTNNFTITAATTTVKPTTFSPFTVTYSTKQSYTPAVFGGSMYFDGTGDYATVPYNSLFNIPASTPVTFEAWVYTTSTNPFIIAGRNWNWGGAGPTWGFVLNSGVTPRWAIAGTGSATYILAESSISGKLGAWNHYAFTRDSSNVVRIFVNGIQGVSRTDSQAMTSASGDVYFGAPSNLAVYSTGFVSGARFLLGQALYTSNFAPGNAPLTAVKNTVLLVNGTPSGAYDTTQNLDLETVSTVSVNNFGPYNAGYYSNQFNGTTDYLGVAANTAFALGTGDFTVEYFIYGTSWSTGPVMIDMRLNGGSASGYSDYITSGGKFSLYWSNATQYTSTATLSVGTWYHIAVARQGTSLRVFINGALDGTITNSTNFTDNTVRIGANTNATPGNYLNGYLSNVRLTKGQALYTSAFTPSTSPLTTTSQGATASNVSLLTCQSNRFIDNSNNTFTVTRTGSTYVQSFNPFGLNNGTSTYYPNNGIAYTQAPLDQSVMGFGTGDYTVELWIYPVIGSSAFFFDTRKTTENRLNISLATNNTGLAVGISTTSIITAASVVTPGAWNFITVTKASGNMRLFVNGVQAGSTTANSTDLGQVGSLCLGCAGDARGNSTYGYTGYISDLRVTKGYARYTSNFTPPTTPFLTL